MKDCRVLEYDTEQQVAGNHLLYAPIVDSSGDEEENAKRRGGLHKPLDGEGRQEVKFFFTEAGTKSEEVTSC